MQFSREDMKVIRFPPVQEHAALGSSRCSISIKGEVLIYKILGHDHWRVRKTLFGESRRTGSLKEAVTWLRLLG